ncbi:hypothetical protein [Peribacillus acanthi]|uniref:UPF0738 family protein n=1 Tax=Peribacillus acanthi TaxID=2171554 RepID=UPI000D3E3C36|nr:hypothetical protein [Peribacillus acanthi]
MRKKITIEDAKISDQQVQLYCGKNIVLENAVATGQMLVDSDNLSFIYIIEHQEEYQYIELTKCIWEELKIGLEQNLPVYLYGEGNLELTNFQDELRYLIDNIEGNSNYGEEMVAEVERIFK